MAIPAVISTPVFKRMLTWKAQHPESSDRFVAYHDPHQGHCCVVVRIRRLKPGRDLPHHLNVCELPGHLFQPSLRVGGSVVQLGWA